MRNSVERMLDRLRTARNGILPKPTTARDGLQEPQQLQAVPVPAPAQPW